MMDIIKKMLLLGFGAVFLAISLITPQVAASNKQLQWPFYTSESPVCNSATTISVSLPGNIPEPHNSLFSQAASAFNTSPQFLATLFLTENGNAWKGFDTAWATSSAGAIGPFQFMPGTWEGYATDGNNDGAKEINNIYDAAFSAAKMMSSGHVTVNTPLGTLDKPFTPGTFLYFSAVYNWGSGSVSRNTTASSPLSVAPIETEHYLQNVYSLITSGFTKSGHPGYGDPSSGLSGTATTPSTTPSTSSAGCACTPTGSVSSTSNRPVIVLDPGHSKDDRTVTDPQTGLDDHDYPNHPEMEDVFDVAKLVEAKLEQDGYQVVMTKTSADQYASLRQRADTANTNKASLAISIHDQGGSSGGLPFSGFQQIYPQKVGGFREKPDGSHKTVFSNADVATKSQQYSVIFQKTRAAAEGNTPVIKDNSFDNRAGIDPGNLALVQLFANVPWVYNEVGGNSAGQNSLSQADKTKYANGLIAGVEQSVPLSGGGSSNASGACSGGVVAGSIVQTALALAWPEPPGDAKPPRDPHSPTEAYRNAVTADGAANGGEDCGIFVAVVMHASGADKNYPDVGTPTQAQYVLDHPEKYQVMYQVKDTSELQAGDILILNAGSIVDSNGVYHVGEGFDGNGHTYIFVGKQSNGYNSASASQDSLMPHLGYAVTHDERGNYLVARLKQ